MDRYGLAINYHFLRPPSSGSPYEAGAAVTPERFSAQLETLQGVFSFCRCRDLLDERLELPESYVVITFDDGLVDIVQYAVPVLERYDIPATFFVCAQPYQEGRVLAVQKVQFLMSRLGAEAFRAAFYRELERQNPRGVRRQSTDYARGYRFYRYDTEDTREFKLDLNYRVFYEQLLPVLDVLFEEVFGKGAEREAVRETYLSADDLKRLADRGFEIGIHGYDHKVLPRLEYDGQKENIAAGRDFLSPIVGSEKLTLACPYGFADTDTRRAMQELEILGCFSVGRRIITPEDLRGRWEIPRFDVNDAFRKSDNGMKEGAFSAFLPVG
jgi:peptidoglycan/xylan/chitin deacetylase (PgdA/CDA1 family)